MFTLARRQKLNNKHNFKKALLFFCLSILINLPSFAVAQDLSLGLEYPGSSGLVSRDLRAIVVSIIRIIFGLLGLIAFLLVAYAGFLWQTSKGDEAKIKTAKSILKNAAIGLAIILSAYAITEFVISRLVGAINSSGGGSTTRQVNYIGGALGGGILQMVYPAPGAVDVARNTMIMVSFKQEIDHQTVIDNNTNGCPANLPPETICGHIKTVDNVPVIKISDEDNNGLGSDDALVMVSADKKQFVVDPLPLLGSAERNVVYKIQLSEAIKKVGGKAVFYTGGYNWSFTTSTVVDSQPPYIVNVQPKINSSAVYANSIIQVNFNEAVNAVAAAGVVSVTNGVINQNSWKNAYIRKNDDNKIISGRWEISNEFKTIEFIPDTPCAMPAGQTVNSCGLVPYCLPTLSELSVLVKAALTDSSGATTSVLSGINDAAGNSLDGGANNGLRRNGEANGRPADDQDQFVDVDTNDNFFWKVNTSSEIDLTPPTIERDGLAPLPGDEGVPRNESVKADFSENLRSSTVNSDNISLFKYDCLLPDPAIANEIPTDPSCFPINGFSVHLENGNRTVVKVHGVGMDGLTVYNSRITNKIEDMYQNCYNPSVGPCEGYGTMNPFCGFDGQPVEVGEEKNQNNKEKDSGLKTVKEVEEEMLKKVDDQK